MCKCNRLINNTCLSLRRDATRTKEIVQQAFVACHPKLLPGDPSQNPVLSSEAIQDAADIAFEMNLVPSRGHIYQIVEAFHGPPSITPFSIAGPDILHTMGGLLTAALGTAMNCLYYIGAIDQAYSSNIGQLDQVLPKVNRFQSSPYWNGARFVDGISKFCTANRVSNVNSTKLLSSVETWRVPPMLLYVLLHIGYSEAYVPCSRLWSINKQLTFAWNPREIISHCLCKCMHAF